MVTAEANTRMWGINVQNSGASFSMGSLLVQMVAFSWVFWLELLACMHGLLGLKKKTSTETINTKKKIVPNFSIVVLVAQT